MTYGDKLRDPRWQKKRLEIFERDEFKCRACTNSKNTLNVHHLKYAREPWEIPNEWLLTLCDDCHGHAEMMKHLFLESMCVPARFFSLCFLLKAFEFCDDANLDDWQIYEAVKSIGLKAKDDAQRFKANL